MKLKKTFIIAFGLLVGTIAVPTIASTYDNIPLTPGQIQFIKLFDEQNGTKFSTLINTPNANRIISAATFACGHIDFQKKVVISSGGSDVIASETSKTFEKLFCDHLNNDGF